MSDRPLLKHFGKELPGGRESQVKMNDADVRAKFVAHKINRKNPKALLLSNGRQQA